MRSSISGNIPNVIGGISQQPPASRLDNTATDMKNAIPSVVSGLRKRPPMKYLCSFGSTPINSISQYVLERPLKEPRFIVAGTKTLQVFKADGTSEPVTISTSGLAYLDQKDPESTFGFLSIADTIFVYNRFKTVQRKTIAETRANPANFTSTVIENTASNVAFKMYVGNQTGTLATATSAPVDVNKVAEGLRDSFNAAGTIAAIKYGNVVSTNSALAADSEPQSLTRSYKDTVSRFSVLPLHERDGRLVKITGNPDENASDSYWVTYAASSKLWTETVGFGAHEGLDPASMPHILKDNGNGTWTFEAYTWDDRKAGDTNSNPSPSFVGNTIRDMFLTNNRLCFLSDENFIASEVGVYSNFYRTTTTALIDSDRIDVAALTANARVSRLYHAVNFDGAVLLFSDKTQFRLDTSEGISPSSVNLRATTGFNASRGCKPVKLGNNVLFIDDSDNSTWADVREYLVDSVVGTNNSEVITKQVPELIPSGVSRMVTNSTLGISLVFSRSLRSRLYLYSSFTVDGERLQSAWSYWEDTGAEFMAGEFIGNSLYLTLNRQGSLVLVRVDLQETIEGDFKGLEVQLDYRVMTPPVTFDGFKSRIALPYALDLGEVYNVVLLADGVDKAGTAYPVTRTGVSEGSVEIDLTGQTFAIGKRYSFVYELSPIFIRDRNRVPVQDGRLQLRYLSFLYHQSSYFRVEVTPPGRGPYTAVFTGRTMGRLTDIIGDVAVDDGEFRVPASGEASRIVIKIFNDSPFQCRFSSIEWEGTWRPRTNRMGA